MSWEFYGRAQELTAMREVFARGRFFFARVTGRRRIGKTTLVQEALRGSGRERVLYVQIPDSAPAGVISAVHDAMATFEVPAEACRWPSSLVSLALAVEELIRAGWVVALDEFQYFRRKHLHEFLSHLQAAVDRLTRDAAQVSGGLVVLGSLHAELVALLDDRDAPLYNRATDVLELPHLDIASVLEILDAHADRAPERLLFLWNLFEGVPKFYRDCYEQGVIGSPRPELLGRMFFTSSSPLRTEAANWFLSELRGRYDVVLKYVARNPGCGHGEIEAHVREMSPETSEQVGGYLKILIERYGLLERRLPIFARPNARSGRYYIEDNFLRSWLAALDSCVAAVNFRPVPLLVEQADAKLRVAEGHGLERLVAQLYAERSRRGVGEFVMSRQIDGYWDKKGTEIDFVAVDDDSRHIRFGSCKRDPSRLLAEPANLQAHVARFLMHHKRYASYRRELVAFAPQVPPELRKTLADRGVLVQDLVDLTKGLV